MKLLTPVKVPNFPFRIRYDDKIISIGSCFSVHITQKLAQLAYNTLQNPSGITYNAASMVRTLKMVNNPDSLHQSPIKYQQGLYSHPDFHGSFNHPDKNKLEKNLRNNLSHAQKFLNNASKVMITLGTSAVFRCLETGLIVNNCHKRPLDHFQKEVLTVSDTTAHLIQIIELIEEMSEIQQAEFLFTLSPIRHTRNGLIADRKSKAIALLAIHELVTQMENCHYFPAYEIQTDELRDYRFYGSDLLHPTPLAIDYIYQRFSENLLDPDDATLRSRVDSIQKRRKHRPLFPDTAEHQEFLSRLRQDEAELKEKHPYLDIE